MCLSVCVTSFVPSPAMRLRLTVAVVHAVQHDQSKGEESKLHLGGCAFSPLSQKCQTCLKWGGVFRFSPCLFRPLSSMSVLKLLILPYRLFLEETGKFRSPYFSVSLIRRGRVYHQRLMSFFFFFFF